MKAKISMMSLFVYVLISGISVADLAAAAKTANVVDIDFVVPIDWSCFEPGPGDDKHVRQCSEILLNVARYNLLWIDKTFKMNADKSLYVHEKMDENGIRPSCCAALALATTLQTGIFDEKAIGVSQEQARRKTAKLIKSVAAVHKSNSSKEKGWGHSWQSRLWSALLAHAGWMLWDNLDSQTREMLVKQLVVETDTLLADDYKVPYWDGISGDTKAEENSWNAMATHVAVGMMPKHPRALGWKRIGSELMISSYATKKDWQENTDVLDGKAVKDWLKGYNAMNNGAVKNHDILHPDYMVAICMNLRAYVTQSLAGGAIPESAHFNSPLIFRTFTSYKWPSPPYKAPGGTIYLPGRPGVYYPQGTDWSVHDFAQFYLLDSYAHILNWDKGMSHTAADWMVVRADKMLKMQSRHEDGRMFAKGEYDTYPGSEQWIAWCVSDAFLPLWLNAQKALSKTDNWLK